MFFEEFKKTLSRVQNPGSYASIGVASELPTFPFISVEGLEETLTVPISAIQTKSLLGLANKASFSDEVSNVWSIPGRKISFGADGWNEAMDALMDRVKEELGVTASVKAELHELLVYPQGGYCEKHRDGEQTPGLFGTLVIALPSRHEGGSLTIYHSGEHKVFESEPHADSDLTLMRYCAFYSSCERDRAVVKSGNRIVLTYNLTCTEMGRLNDHAQSEVEVALGVFADKWALDNDAPLKLCYMLEHQYRTRTMGWHSLVERDRAISLALRKCGRYDLLLVSITYTVDSDIVVGLLGKSELITGTSVAWRIIEDGSPLFGVARCSNIEIKRCELVQGEQYFEGIHTQSELNLPHVSKQYYRAAIIAWPKESRAKVLGFRGGVAMLGSDMKGNSGNGNNGDVLLMAQKCCEQLTSCTVDATSILKFLKLIATTAFPLDLYCKTLKHLSLTTAAYLSGSEVDILSEEMLMAGRKGSPDEAAAAHNVRQAIAQVFFDSARKSYEGLFQSWRLMQELYRRISDQGQGAKRILIDLREAILDGLIDSLGVPFPIPPMFIYSEHKAWGGSRDHSNARYEEGEKLLTVVLETLIRSETEKEEEKDKQHERLQAAVTKIISNPNRFHPLYSVAISLSRFLSHLSSSFEISDPDVDVLKQLAISSGCAIPNKYSFYSKETSSLLNVLSITDGGLESHKDLFADINPISVVVPAVLETFKMTHNLRSRRDTEGLVNILLAAIERASCYKGCRTYVDYLVDAFDTLWVLDNEKHSLQDNPRGGCTSSESEGEGCNGLSPTYCARLVSIMESAPVGGSLKVVVAAALVDKLMTRLSPAARSHRDFLSLVDVVLSKLRAVIAVPLPLIVDWKITDIKFTCTCEACDYINIFLKNPEESEIRIEGPYATWSGHATLNAERLAKRSAGRLQVHMLCSKACRVRGEFKMVKVLPGRTPVAKIRSRPADEMQRKEFVAQIAKFEAFQVNQLAVKSEEDLSASGVTTASGKEEVKRSIVLEDESVVKKQRTA